MGNELIQHTPFLYEYQAPGGERWMIFRCPGCDEHHAFVIPRWTFNGNYERPTFEPSLLMNRNLADYPGCGPRCHLFLRNGQIQFLSDCEHKLAGQLVAMVEYDS